MFRPRYYRIPHPGQKPNDKQEFSEANGVRLIGAGFLRFQSKN